MTTRALIVAGTHSGSGKTTVALAIMAALVRRGVRVQGFKVGPDFIDPGHQARVTGRASRNLDTWLLDSSALAATYRRGTPGADLAIIEGVMGLFDGRGPRDESGSTADLARRWRLPVVLVVDARGLARSIAPLVQGYARFDESVRVAAVVANRVGSRRHHAEYLEPALRAEVRSVEPVGYLARDPALGIPSRHLGLLTADELAEDAARIDALAAAAEATIDLDRLVALARAPELGDDPPAQVPTTANAVPARPLRVGLARDAAFCFYYEDNLDALRAAGAEIVPFSPLADRALPEALDLLYLGGGYPEVHAARLAANTPIRDQIRRHHASGNAILAECGGLMACTETIQDASGTVHPLWGLIPARCVLHRRFAALGYATVVTDRPTLLGPAGTSVRGHEFHYSSLEPLGPLSYATRIERAGEPARPDGIEIGGLLAGYAHLHFGSNPAVATAILNRSV